MIRSGQWRLERLCLRYRDPICLPEKKIQLPTSSHLCGVTLLSRSPDQVTPQRWEVHGDQYVCKSEKGRLVPKSQLLVSLMLGKAGWFSTVAVLMLGQQQLGTSLPSSDSGTNPTPVEMSGTQPSKLKSLQRDSAN